MKPILKLSREGYKETELLRISFSLCLCVCVLCACHMCGIPEEARKGCQIPHKWSYCLMRLLGTKFRSLGRAASDYSCLGFSSSLMGLLKDRAMISSRESGPPKFILPLSIGRPLPVLRKYVFHYMEPGSVRSTFCLSVPGSVPAHYLSTHAVAGSLLDT